MATINYVGNTDLLYTLNKLKQVLENGYVAKVNGKTLSSNDFTDELLTKLNGIAAGAEVNVQSDWSVTDNTSDAYIANKPQNLVQDESYVHTDNNFTTTLKDKLDGISDSADAVSATAELTTGTKLATITINGTDVEIYMPTPQAVTFDTEVSDDSTNGVQNKVIKKYVDDSVGAITGIDFEIPDGGELPATGKKGVIYLIPNSGSGSNIYDEYIWLSSSSKFEKIGTTDVDLSGYVQSSDLVEISTSDIDTMFQTVFGLAPTGD